jgi:hypothetical protein
MIRSHNRLVRASTRLVLAGAMLALLTNTGFAGVINVNLDANSGTASDRPTLSGSPATGTLTQNGITLNLSALRDIQVQSGSAQPINPPGSGFPENVTPATSNVVLTNSGGGVQGSFTLSNDTTSTIDGGGVDFTGNDQALVFKFSTSMAMAGSSFRLTEMGLGFNPSGSSNDDSDDDDIMWLYFSSSALSATDLTGSSNIADYVLEVSASNRAALTTAGILSRNGNNDYTVSLGAVANIANAGLLHTSAPTSFQTLVVRADTGGSTSIDFYVKEGSFNNNFQPPAALPAPPAVVLLGIGGIFSAAAARDRRWRLAKA